MSLDPQIDALFQQLAAAGAPAPESRTVRENRAPASSLPTQEVRRHGGPRIALQVLAYPAVERFDDSPSMYENTAVPLPTRVRLEWFRGLYLTSPDEGVDLRVSPAASDALAGLPPAQGAGEVARPTTVRGSPSTDDLTARRSARRT